MELELSTQVLLGIFIVAAAYYVGYVVGSVRELDCRMEANLEGLLGSRDSQHANRGPRSESAQRTMSRHL